VIEVADESEEYDRQEKIPRYAAFGIPEAWLVAVNRATIEQYTEPRNDRYRNMRILEPGDLLACQSVPRLQLAVKEIFA
jgi:Uma2 family endonuclease